VRRAEISKEWYKTEERTAAVLSRSTLDYRGSQGEPERFVAVVTAAAEDSRGPFVSEAIAA